MAAEDDVVLSPSRLPPAALLLMLNLGKHVSKQPQAGGDLLLSIHYPPFH